MYDIGICNANSDQKTQCDHCQMKLVCEDLLKQAVLRKKDAAGGGGLLYKKNTIFERVMTIFMGKLASLDCPL